jgi:predicted ATPase with chaperone activity
MSKTSRLDRAEAFQRAGHLVVDDLAGTEAVAATHIAEAVQYRRLEKY